MSVEVKTSHTIGVRLSLELQHELVGIAEKRGYQTWSDLIRDALELFASLHKLEVYPVTVDTDKMVRLLKEEKHTLQEAVDKFGNLKRAIELLVEAIEGAKAAQK
jgi:predicted DNA-binding protein